MTLCEEGDATCLQYISDDVLELVGDCVHDCTQTVAYLDELLKRPNPVLDDQEQAEYEQLLEAIGTPEAYPATVVQAYVDSRYCGYTSIAGAFNPGGPACPDNHVAYSAYEVSGYWQCKLDSE